MLIRKPTEVAPVLADAEPEWLTDREEVLRAGFRFDADAGDLCDWNGSPIGKAEKPEAHDRFCLRFVRPHEP